MKIIEICSVEDIVLNTGVAALVAGEQVAVFRVLIDGQEKLFAMSNYDPFANANVISRGIVCSIDGVPAVASPIYKQHYNLSSGQCLEDESVVLPTWVVAVEAGKVYLALAPEKNVPEKKVPEKVAA